MAEVINIHGDKYYTTVKECLEDIVKENNYTKFILLALDEDKYGGLHKFNLTDEQAIAELETAKTYMVNKRVR